MQSIQIPDKAENEIRILLKREDYSSSSEKPNTGRLEAKLEAMENVLMQFTSSMQKTMQEMSNKMNHLQDLMESIANQQLNERRRVTKIEDFEGNGEQCYPVIMEDTQEVQIMEEEEDDMGAEYILDEIELSQEHHDDTEDTTVDIGSPVKRRNSSVSRPQPKIKRVKSEVIPIHNYQDDAKDALIQIVESVAACESIRSNVDGEETISNVPNYKNDTIADIRIQQDSKYEFITVTEELDFEFPITELAELKRLNSVLNSDPRMVDAMRVKLSELSTQADYNFQRALQRLVADSVMHLLNWQGLKGKTRMKDMKLFSEVLYQTWFQHIDMEQYEEFLKIITKKAHKRYSKTQERKRHRMQGGPHRILNMKLERT
ncbi:uncharacterized protein LOC134838102 [Culicoides brevitarsis]|uniref:uncharacterized protein LOC134838102 n=1 Tax=Culicoides brevitarsis TaxID=469753 RepID=UPI00307B9D43